jgi:hypothetical protein
MVVEAELQRRPDAPRRDSHPMMHFTCDVCGKEIRSAMDRRFVVKVETYAAHEPAELTEDDLDTDSLEEMGELLRHLEETHQTAELVPAHANLRFDLCAECHVKFLRDPLGKEANPKLFFSEN